MKRMALVVLFSFWCLASCKESDVEPPGRWSDAQLDQYDRTCSDIASDLYNTPFLTKKRGSLDTHAICTCARPSAIDLFPTSDEWRLTVQAIPAANRLGGRFTFLCTSSRDPNIVNWCVALRRCSEPEEKMHPFGAAR